MILECVGAILAILFIGIAGYLLELGAKNRRKYEFFEKNAPGLKVVPNPSLFGGHTNQLFNIKHNIFLVEDALKKYGPTVGVYFGTRPGAITIDLEFIKTFTIDEQIHTNRGKLDLPFEELERDSIMFAEDEQWLKIRRAIAPAFTAHRIKSPNVQADTNGVIDKLIGLIERKLDAEQRTAAAAKDSWVEFDLEDICGRFALALLFTNFYKQDNVIDFHSEKDKWREIVANNLHDLIGLPVKVCAAFPVVKPLMNWLTLNFHPNGVVRNTIMDYIKRQTKLNFEATRQMNKKTVQGNQDHQQQQNFDADNFILKDGSKFRRNMIDYVTDQYREGKLTESEYFNSTFFLFLAANNTILDGLSRAVYNLAWHQEIQEKLRESIRESGPESEYLAWVLNETLRLHPPVPAGCSRVIERDIQTKHGLVPAGTFVSTPARTINRLKEYWGDDADEFRPERWADAKNFHPVQYLSFGGGRRICPGKELALMELKLTLSALMRRYKFDRSLVQPTDNSDKYSAPIFAFMVFDTPTCVRISRIQ